jgi:hypothetical protein
MGFYGGGCGFYCGYGSEADEGGRQLAGELGWAEIANLGLGGVAKFLSIRGLPGIVRIAILN